jgi:hypothetical protein
MKAIHQLILYFEERNQLSKRQLDELLAKGFKVQYTSADLRSLEKKIGQSFFFQTTGSNTGPLWGTDTYTSDSELGTACVHAGVLKVGETGTVKVTMVQPVPVFTGSMRNSISSARWDSGWQGAFQVEALKK